MQVIVHPRSRSPHPPARRGEHRRLPSSRPTALDFQRYIFANPFAFLVMKEVPISWCSTPCAWWRAAQMAANHAHSDATRWLPTAFRLPPREPRVWRPRHA